MKNQKHVVLLLTVFVLGLCLPLAAQQTRDLMEMSLEELMNLTITTAGKQEQKISDIPASVVVITREDIERYGYTSLVEVLQNVPGLYYINDMSYYGDSFGVRGFFSSQQRNIIFMVDGVHQFDGFWKVCFSENFNLPVEAIDRIEVVRGPMSVVYGSGAFFGAINIITNQKDREDFSAVSITGGSLGTLRVGTNMSGTTGDLNYSISANYFKTNGPDVPYSKMTDMDLSGFGVNETNNTTKNRLDDENKYFNIALDYKGLYARVTYSESGRDEYILLPSVSDGLFKQHSFATGMLGYRTDISRNLTMDANVSYHKYAWFAEFDLLTADFWDYEFTGSEEAEADLALIYNPSNKWNFTAGLHHASVSHIKGFDLLPAFEYNVDYSLPDKPIITNALYLDMDFMLSKRLRFVAGARLERMNKYDIGVKTINPADLAYGNYFDGTFDKDDIHFIPRFAAIYSLNENNHLKLLYGKAIRHPEYQPNTENMMIGKPYLDPEFINTYELNYISTISANLTVNVSLFQNQFQNMIVRTIGFDDQGTMFTYYDNVGDVKTTGVELSIVAKPFSNFLLDLSGTYQKTEDQREAFKDIDVSFSPSLFAHIKASYEFGNTAIASVTGRYVDDMYPEYSVTDGVFLGEKVDGYFVLDGNLSFKNLFGKGFYTNIRCTNMFNTDYLFPVNGNILFANRGVIGRGVARSIMVTLGKKF
jgi:outer membrane receptor protein involved in Fe transport